MNETFPRAPGRLPRAVTPVAYDLVLEVDPRKERFSGECTIHVDVNVETKIVNLHARGLDIRRVEARREDDLVSPGHLVPPSGPGAEPEAGEIAVELDDELPRGHCELYFDFEAPFGQLAGLYRVNEGGRWYAFTQFEAADARRAFPCFDEPSFKVPFRTTLLLPEGMDGFSNTPEVERDTSRGLTLLRFHETKPLPTYLLAFAVGPLEIVRGEGKTSVPVRMLVPTGKGHLAKTALSFVPGILSALEDWFGRPYPYEKLDLVAVPEFGAGAMENAGLITFREEYLLADPERLTRQRQRRIAEVMAHEIAHHWFGNLVTMHWWEDLWLNEAFATWMAAKAVDAWRPDFDQRMDLLQVRNRAMSLDSLPAARKVRQEVGSVGEAEQAFDDLTYYKGASVLTMLEAWIGEDAFREGVRAYLEHHEWGNATAADLFSHLDKASGQDVSGVAASFLDKPGVPLVTVGPGEGGRTSFAQRPYALLGLDPPCAKDARWHVPLRVGEGWHVLTDAREDVKVPLGSSGHPNAGEWSYYRWVLPEADLARLAAHQDALDVRSRLGLLESAWAMVSAGARGPDAYLAVLERMREVTERPLLEELVSGLARVEDVWEEIGGRPEWTGLVRETLEGQMARLGFDPRPGEPEDDTLVRPIVMRALGRLGADGRVLEAAAERAARTLADPRSVSPDVAAASLALAALKSRVSFDELLSLHAQAGDPEQRIAALRALAMLPEQDVLRALELTLTEKIRAQDFRYVFGDAMARPEVRDATFGWLREHFAAVRARQPEFTFVHIGSFIGLFRDAAARDAAEAFLVSQKVAGGERAIRQGVERATHAIALRAAGRDALEAYLSGRAPGA